MAVVKKKESKNLDDAHIISCEKCLKKDDVIISLTENLEKEKSWSEDIFKKFSRSESSIIDLKQQIKKSSLDDSKFEMCLDLLRQLHQSARMSEASRTRGHGPILERVETYLKNFKKLM